MSRNLPSKTLLCGALAVAGLLQAMPSAEAATVRVRFTPPYGAPFDEATNGAGNALEWSGEALMDDGGCALTGEINNLGGPCANSFSFTSAVLYLANTNAPNVPLQTIDLLANSPSGGEVFKVKRNTTTTAYYIESAPFIAVQGTQDETKYMGNQAYFSLQFVGEYAQLIWFSEMPKTPGHYTACLNVGPGVNNVAGFKCGTSANLEGAGALLEITPVPEPSTYALMFAGLGALAFVAKRRRQQG